MEKERIGNSVFSQSTVVGEACRLSLQGRPPAMEASVTGIAKKRRRRSQQPRRICLGRIPAEWFVKTSPR